MKALRIVASLAVLAGPLASQMKPHNWYWGAQAGGLIYRTNLQPYYYDPIVGGHWFITGQRTALYLSYEQAFFIADAISAVSNPAAPTNAPDTVTFNQVRRISIGVMAMPKPGHIEPVFGGGFAIMEITNPTVVACPTCQTAADAAAAQDRANGAASKAFFFLSGGLEITAGKLALFGHYILTSTAQNFLLLGNTHTLEGGIRYSFGTAKEDVTDQH